MTDPIIDIRDLPLLLQDWVTLIGLDATLSLVDQWGGVRVYIPRPEHLTPDHWLPRLIGLDAAEALARVHAGEEVLVPMAARALNKLKEARILADLAGGLSVRDVARKHRVHERRVWRIKARAASREPDPQQVLF